MLLRGGAEEGENRMIDKCGDWGVCVCVFSVCLCVCVCVLVMSACSTVWGDLPSVISNTADNSASRIRACIYVCLFVCTYV